MEERRITMHDDGNGVTITFPAEECVYAFGPVSYSEIYRRRRTVMERLFSWPWNPWRAFVIERRSYTRDSASPSSSGAG